MFACPTINDVDASGVDQQKMSRMTFDVSSCSLFVAFLGAQMGSVNFYNLG
jgi:hypothetical protein